jgi:hypothetical protein
MRVRSAIKAFLPPTGRGALILFSCALAFLHTNRVINKQVTQYICENSKYSCMVDDFILFLSLPPKIAADLKDSSQWPCCHVFGTFRIRALRFSAVTYSFSNNYFTC